MGTAPNQNNKSGNPTRLLRALRVFVSSCLIPGLAAAQATEDPAIELKSFKVHPDLEVSLFASEPMVENPIGMNFDPQGRLWVVCSPTYPQFVPTQPPNDYLAVLEDTDGDGKADKSHKFVDDLCVPTGFALGDGGVYISNQPDILFLKDTDGDGKADERRVLLSSFGTEDNHHNAHVYTWGPGGLLYFQSGVFLHNAVETPWGPVRREDGCVWQFRPRSMELTFESRCYEYYNPWGHTFDRWGQDFLTEAPGGDIFHLTPGAGNEVAPGPYPRMNGAPKSCGIQFVESRHFPDGWQGDLILNAFKNRTVLRYRLSDDGSSFAAKELGPVLESTHESFRPVDVKLGPDGALYILDWYNPIIGHMQYNLRDPRRDHQHGRVWRLTAKGRPLLKPPTIAGASVPALLEKLKSPESYVRYMSHRVLYDLYSDPAKQKEISALLKLWAAGLDPSDPDAEHRRLEALWISQTIDAMDGALLRDLLRSKDARVRAAAVRVVREIIMMPRWKATKGEQAGRPPVREEADALVLLEPMVADENPRVRLEAVTALSYVPTPRAVELALRALDRTTDRHIEYALKMAVNALKPHWLPALSSGEMAFSGNARHLEFALQSVGTEAVVAPMLALLKSGKIPPERQGDALSLVAGLAGPDQLAALFAESYDTPVQARFLAALEKAARERNVRPAGDLVRVKTYFTHADDSLRIAAIRLAGAWKLAEVRGELATAAGSGESPLKVREAAVDAILDLGGSESVGLLRDLCTPPHPPRLRLKAAAALASIDPSTAAPVAAEVLSSDLGGTDPAPVFAVFLQKKGGAEALAAALTGKKVPEPVAAAGLRAMNAAGRKDEELRKILEGSGEVGAPREAPLQIRAEDMPALLAEISAKGDPERGERVFRRKDLLCLQCHAISGAGGNVGPDLSGIGAGSPVDYLVDSVLTPAKAVREGFQSLAVQTKDEEVFTGVVVRRSEKDLVLRDAVRGEFAVPVASIAQEKDAGSVMPSGLADKLSRKEFADLIRFLSELGRPGPYAARNIPVVRRWRALENIPPEALETGVLKESGLSAVAPGAKADDLRWIPVYATVSGVVPLEDLPTEVGTAKPRAKVDGASTKPDVSFLRAEVNVTTPGRSRLRINSVGGLMLWVDGEKVDVTDNLIVDLKAGLRTLTFWVNHTRRGGKGLRVEFEEVPEGAARVQVVGGR